MDISELEDSNALLLEDNGIESEGKEIDLENKGLGLECISKGCIKDMAFSEKATAEGIIATVTTSVILIKRSKDTKSLDL